MHTTMRTSLSNVGKPPRAALALWAVSLVAFCIWTYFNGPGWDVVIYMRGVRAVAAGLDPYAAGMALQRAYQAHPVPGVSKPYSYVYSVITFPLLHLIALLPLWLAGILYWTAHATAVFAEIWVALHFVQHDEETLFAYLAPLVPFFPGLLQNETIQSGNISYVLYAAIFVAALYAWRRGHWIWFYVAVLLASCVKAPELILLLIPVLTARRQLLPAAIALGIGTAIIAIQPLLWPVLFRHNMEALTLQTDLYRDFGCSPVGLYSAFRFDRGLPYTPSSYVVYSAYALLDLACLGYCARLFFRGGVALLQWVPVLMVGILLLNPRVQEYDVVLLTLPMALIAWRWLTMFTSRSKLVLSLTTVLWVILNAFSIYSWELRKQIEGPLLVILFIAGVLTLHREALAYRDTPSNGELAVA
jgi:hypothetical protein